MKFFVCFFKEPQGIRIGLVSPLAWATVELDELRSLPPSKIFQAWSLLASKILDLQAVDGHDSRCPLLLTHCGLDESRSMNACAALWETRGQLGKDQRLPRSCWEVARLQGCFCVACLKGGNVHTENHSLILIH